MSEYHIWSHEHGAWWRPGSGGYTQKLSEAGVYSRDRALQICLAAMPGTSRRIGALPELPVLVADAQFLRDAFLKAYPIAATVETWL